MAAQRKTLLGAIEHGVHAGKYRAGSGSAALKLQGHPSIGSAAQPSRDSICAKVYMGLTVGSENA